MVSGVGLPIFLTLDEVEALTLGVASGQTKKSEVVAFFRKLLADN